MEDQNEVLRKKDSLDRMMIEANSYMPDQDYVTDSQTGQQVMVSRFQKQDPKRKTLPSEMTELDQKTRERMLTIMMTDHAGRKVLKDRYPQLNIVAKSEEARINRVASYGTFEKLRKGVSWGERKQAREAKADLDQKKKDLAAHRKEELEERKAFYRDRLEQDSSDMKARVDELRSKTDADSMKEMITLQIDMKLGYVPQMRKEDLHLYSVVQMMSVHEKQSERERARRLRKNKAADKLEDDGKLVSADWDQDLLYSEGLPLLCDNEEDTEDEQVQEIANTAIAIDLLKQKTKKDPKLLKAQKDAFRRSMNVIVRNFEILNDAKTLRGDLFTGSIHPEVLMFSGMKQQGLTVNDKAGESEAFSLLFEMKRRSGYARWLLNIMGDSDIYRELYEKDTVTQEEHELLTRFSQMKPYMDSMDAYLSKVFEKMEEWDLHYTNGEEGEIDYRTKSLEAIRGKM